MLLPFGCRPSGLPARPPLESQALQPSERAALGCALPGFHSISPSHACFPLPQGGSKAPQRADNPLSIPCRQSLRAGLARPLGAPTPSAPAPRCASPSPHAHAVLSLFYRWRYPPASSRHAACLLIAVAVPSVRSRRSARHPRRRSARSRRQRPHSAQPIRRSAARTPPLAAALVPPARPRLARLPPQAPLARPTPPRPPLGPPHPHLAQAHSPPFLAHCSVSSSARMYVRHISAAMSLDAALKLPSTPACEAPRGTLEAPSAGES